MRIVLACFAALALAAVVASADEIGVPDNNPATGAACNIGPFGYAEARHQTLVPASMLGNNSFLINELSFASCRSPSPTLAFSTLVVTFAHTSQATLSTLLATNLAKDATVVLNGPVTWPTTYQQWSPIGLTGSFLYNGVDNLVVEVKFIGKTGGSLGCYRSNNVQRAYRTGTGTFNIPTAPTSMSALKMRLTVDRVQLLLSGTPRPGGTVTLDMLSPADANLPYVLGASLGNGPIQIDTRTLGLSPDDLLVVTTFGLLPTVFVNYTGTLDATGKAQATFNILNDPRLRGVRIYHAFVTLSGSAPSGIKSISPSVLLVLN